MRFIGITGGVGAGKSAIISFLSEHYKCKIYMADDVAHEVRKPGTECHKQLVDLLGTDVVADNKKMAIAVFSDEELLKKVNDIIHPAVEKYILNARDDAEKSGKYEMFFLEAALLIEAGYKQILDELWYVYADPEIRIDRLMENRGYTREKAIKIMDSQLSDEIFRENADFIIDNSASLDKAYEQIKRRLGGYTWLK